MAAGDTPKFPSPVTFDDELPKGCASIMLTVPELRVKGFMTKEPKNAIVTPVLKKESVEVTIVVEGGKTYKYHRLLPADIVPEKSSIKYKDQRVIVCLKKAVAEAWDDHKFFIIPSDQ